jgi:hypothetical protein
MLTNLKQLQRLDLCNNRLGFILNGSLPRLVRHGTLALDTNRIMYIEASTLSIYSTQDDLTLEVVDNPFYCDCNLLGFSKWLRDNNGSVAVKELDSLTCGGPITMYGKQVLSYYAFWWQCSLYIPLIALVAIIGLAVLMASFGLMIYCNRVNIRHWRLERQAHEGRGRTSDITTERRGGKGKTGAYIIYDMSEEQVLGWANGYLEEHLQQHPIRVSLQWPAGPDFIPLWKQVKEHGFGVKHFLVIITDNILEHHWPDMSEKSGYDNLMKFVLVLMGKRKSDLPKELINLGCPCLEWPETKTCCSTLRRKREQFWKRLRLVLKDGPA